MNDKKFLDNQTPEALAKIINAFPIPFVIFRVEDGAILYSNALFDAVRTQHHLDYALDSFRKRVEKNNVIRDREIHFHDADGESSWMLAGGQLETLDDTQVVLVTLQDLTPQKQALEVLARSEERYRAFAQFLSDYAYTYRIDPDSTMVREWFTPSYTTPAGFNPVVMDLINDAEKYVHPQDIDIIQHQIRTLTQGESDVAEFRILTEEDEICWLRNYVHPIWDYDHKRIARFYGMSQDITYRKKAEEALLYGAAQDIAYRQNTELTLRKYTTELEAVNEELDAYTHTIAHDLKAPLGGIIGFVDLLKYFVDSDPEKLPIYIERINSSAEHMLAMIDQLLAMAHLRNATETVERTEISPILDQVVLRFVQEMEKEGVVIHFDNDLPAAMAHAPWLEEVFANLIGNSIKYMGDENPAPQIRINAKRENGSVRYEVSDNGIGIPEEHQGRLFEMFTRVNPGKKEGLGLGLSIVKRIITKLNGKLGVESTAGEGSTFWFSLPAAEE